jgi:hypothetical protein
MLYCKRRGTGKSRNHQLLHGKTSLSFDTVPRPSIGTAATHPRGIFIHKINKHDNAPGRVRTGANVEESEGLNRGRDEKARRGQASDF